MSEKGQLNQQASERAPECNAFFGKTGDSNCRTQAVGLLGDKSAVAAANEARVCPLPLAHAADLTTSADRFSDVLKQAGPQDCKYDPSKALSTERTADGGARDRVADAVVKAAGGEGTVRTNLQSNNVAELPVKKEQKAAV